MRHAIVVAAVVVSGCGDNHAIAGDAPVVTDGAPDAGEVDVLVQLQALPGVTVTEQTAPPHYRYFELEVTQPLDHDAVSGPTFQQEVFLVHRSLSAPMTVVTSGYDDFLHEDPAEPTVLLQSNQISIEHRFFGTSRPSPEDWSKLTIAQMAADEHAIITLLKGIYHAPWISTGASKGGMTAVFHRRFYPDDVAGTLAYVAPLSFAIPDARYATFIDTVGTSACRTAIRAVATEMLHNRRQALLTRAQAQGGSYTRIAIGPALESAIEDLEWSFWQYSGVSLCPSVPAVTATDAELYSFLDNISPVNFSTDAPTLEFEAYFYQAYSQLGSPGTTSIRGDSPPPQLEPFRLYDDSDYTGSLPLGVAIPAFDPTAMQDIDNWVQTEGKDLIFVYGEWDPWSGGKFRVGAATDSLEAVVAHGVHGSQLSELPTADRDAALAKLAAWTGVTPGAAAVVHPARRHRHGPAGFTAGGTL